jgi:hypothetical protein
VVAASGRGKFEAAFPNKQRTSPMRLILPALLFILTPVTHAQEWQPVATELLAKEKPGPFGLCGVLVDHATGTLYVNLSDRGVYRSNDQGKTWTRHGKERKGRTETPGCFQLDPTGTTRKFVLSLVYGAPVMVGSTDPEGTSRRAFRHSHGWSTIRRPTRFTS